MTHYMELLASDQPWNLMLFMAIPVILAETIAVSELYILFARPAGGTVRRVSRVSGVILACYMVGVVVYLVINAVIPITTSNAWRGVGDVIAVGGYLASALPLIAIGALELRLIGRTKIEDERLRLHAIFVGAFLVLAHIAMIFGMLDPELLR